MDLHHNLFYTYRGPTIDADRDPQLENNLTKALINTLRLGAEGAHQSIAVAADGLKMFVNIETRLATNRLNAAMKEGSTRDKFLKVLQNLHAVEPFQLVLDEVFWVGPHRATSTAKMRLDSSMLMTDEAGDGAWTAFADTVVRLKFLYFCLDRPQYRRRR
jgi:hypothetical protein